MSKEQLNEMKRLLGIMVNLNEAPSGPSLRQLKKAAKIMQEVADAIQEEADEMRADDHWDGDDEMYEMYNEDAADYYKVSKLLAAGKGKRAAELYDDMDTANRESIYDYLSSDEINFLEKVFDKLGSFWLHTESVNHNEIKNLDEAYTSMNNSLMASKDDGVCSKCKREDCSCEGNCDCPTIEEDARHSITTIIGDDGLRQLRNDLQTTGDIDSSSEYYELLYSYYLDSGEMPHGTAKARTGDPESWIMDHIYQDYGDELDIESDDPYADEGWEDIVLGPVTEDVLSENQPLDYENDLGPAEKGKSNIVKDIAKKKGLDVDDLGLSDYPEAEDEELGLRFD